MSYQFTVALLLSLVCLATPARADFETGMDAYERGNYTTALSEWRPLAEKGDAQAQLHLGMLYHQAQGVPQDYTAAREWYEKAAAQGYAMAQFNLGLLYDNGDGVPQNYAKARQWYEKAAARGYAMAQTNLGGLYANGQGVSQDDVWAYMWYSLAAEQSTDPRDTHAADRRENVAHRMTPTQVVKAQKLAREWTLRTP